MLTKKRRKTLTHSYKEIESNQYIQYVFVDVTGKLKLRLNEHLEHSKYIYRFHSNEDLKDIFDKFGWDIMELHHKV